MLGIVGMFRQFTPKPWKNLRLLWRLLGLFGVSGPSLCFLLLNLSTRHSALQRRIALLFKFWMRECLARQHLIAHSCVVHKRRFHGCGLCQILFLEALVGVHVGVMGARSVVEAILDELEPWDADGVEGLVICAASVAHGDRGDAKVLERLHPLREDRGQRRILLQPNAANASTPV